MKVPIARPSFDETDRAAIVEPLETGWVVQGPKVAEFESLFADYVGAPRAAACSSATTGLHLALATAGIGPGDEVIVPAFTWVATANAVLYCGARPVFCDVDLDTFNLNADDLAARVTDATKALAPVHLFGLPADMGAVGEVARAKSLTVVEDAACGLAARIDGQHVGTMGDFGVFSFHPRKALTTGEGGMVLARDADADALIRSLRDHGAGTSDRARHESKQGYLLGAFNVMGFNYRMTDFQGALGVSQMAKAEWVHARRTALAHRYDEALADLDWLVLPRAPEGVTHGYQSYVCLFRPEAPTLGRLDTLNARRDALMKRLADEGVSTRQGTHAVHALGLYRERFGLRPEDYPGAWMAERLSIALPLFPDMTEAEQDHVISCLRGAM